MSDLFGGVRGRYIQPVVTFYTPDCGYRKESSEIDGPTLSDSYLTVHHDFSGIAESPSITRQQEPQVVTGGSPKGISYT
jgi:hypothetical protein